MDGKEIYASLDIGSSTIKLLVGEIVNHNVRVLRVESIPSRGVKRGVIADERCVVEDIKQLVERVEYLLSIKLLNVVLLIPSVCLGLYKGRGSCVIKRESKIIEAADITKALRSASQFEIPKDEVMLTTLPLNFILDGHATRHVPIGEVARQVVVNALVVSAPKEMVYAFASVVEASGLEISEICMSAYAHASESLDATLLHEGVMLIDMGAQVTTITVFEDGYLKSIGSLPIGGYQITKDIARILGAELSVAENLKIKYGVCYEENADNDVIYVSQESEDVFTQKDIAKIIQERMLHQLDIVSKQVSAMIEDRDFKIIVVGGGAQLEGIQTMIQRSLGMNARVYTPDTIGARKSMLVGNLGAIYYLLDRSYYLGHFDSAVDLKGFDKAITLRKTALKGTPSTDEGGLLNRIVDFLFGEEKE